MSNFKSFVERTVHVQLQHFTRFQTPISLFAALLVFSSLPIVGRTSSASVSALATTLGKALTKLSTSERVPLLTSLFNIFTRALNAACLGVRIHVKIPIQWRHMFNRGHGPPRSDDTYATPRAEAKYWRVADRYRRRLYSGNGTTFTPSMPFTASRDGTVIPLVTYYTPRLLPLYRNRSGGKRTSREADVEAQEGRISPRTFCKWHRMVFQGAVSLALIVSALLTLTGCFWPAICSWGYGQCHPTLAQAAVQMKYYSNRDLREIQHIARLLPDEQVFDPKRKGTRKAKGSTKYSEMWRNWLENKRTDLVIVFE